MLVGAEPAPNSTIGTTPKQIKLLFNEALQDVGHTIALLDEKQNKIAIGKAMLDPKDQTKKTIIAEIPTALATGNYTVDWKALSTDGHTVKGSFKFTLAEMAR